MELPKFVESKFYQHGNFTKPAFSVTARSYTRELWYGVIFNLPWSRTFFSHMRCRFKSNAIYTYCIGNKGRGQDALS